MLAAGQPSAADDAAGDFSPTSNPTGSWSYGFSASVGSVFNLYPTPVTTPDGLEAWCSCSQSHGIVYNPTDSVIHGSGTTSIPPETLAGHPGSSGQCSVVRWTAPSAGNVLVLADFEGRSGFGGAPLTTTDVHVLQNDVSFFDALLNIGGAPNSAAVAEIRTVAVGDRIDFVVGRGNGRSMHRAKAR
jgi:hypothetical protein